MKRLFYLLLAALMVLAVSCKKNPNGTDPKVQEPSAKTLEATDIKTTSARLHAMIDFAGVDWDICNYGFSWGTSEDTKGSYISGEGILDKNNAYSAGVTGLAPETEYWYRAYVEIDGSPYSGDILHFTTAADPIPEEAVDLGVECTLPDGTKYTVLWAAYNLCEDGFVSSAEQYGDYYAWGETVPHYTKGHSGDNPCTAWRTIEGKAMTGYNWASYRWCNGFQNKINKYCSENSADYWDGEGTPDNKVDLKDYDYADDAARVTLRGKWRIPTAEEWTALRTQCPPTETTVNGVLGKKFTSANGKSIFLPAAGVRYGDGLDNVGLSGLYWASSIHLANPNIAYQLCFDAGTAARLSQAGRLNGYSIRPVYVE